MFWFQCLPDFQLYLCSMLCSPTGHTWVLQAHIPEEIQCLSLYLSKRGVYFFLSNLGIVTCSRFLPFPYLLCLISHQVLAILFSLSHLKKGWLPKNWCLQTVVLEKTPESPLDNKKIKPVHHKGNQLWTFTGRTDAEAETPILWPRDVKSWLTGKDPDAAKDWAQEAKGTREEEMVGWHHWLSGHEFEQTPGDGERQGSLACCSLGGRKESDMTERLNNKNLAILSQKDFSQSFMPFLSFLPLSFPWIHYFINLLLEQSNSLLHISLSALVVVSDLVANSYLIL